MPPFDGLWELWVTLWGLGVGRESFEWLCPVQKWPIASTQLAASGGHGAPLRHQGPGKRNPAWAWKGENRKCWRLLVMTAQPLHDDLHKLHTGPQKAFPLLAYSSHSLSPWDFIREQGVWISSPTTFHPSCICPLSHNPLGFHLFPLTEIPHGLFPVFWVGLCPPWLLSGLRG